MRFTLKSRDGNNHQYDVAMHPAIEGMQVSAQLGSLGIPTLVVALGSALESQEMRAAVAQAFAKGGSSTDKSRGLDELMRIAGGFDFSTIGTEVRTALQDPRLATLVRAVLQHTTRDDVVLSGDVALNGAFTGNYMEMWKAVWEIVQVNGFFPELPSLQKPKKSPQRRAPKRKASGTPRTSPSIEEHGDTE